MKNFLPILWAFAAGVLNNHVPTATSPTAPALSFRRGADEIKLVHLDAEKPGWATVEMPDGNHDTFMLADGELGQLVTNYGRATGNRIELPALLGYGDEQAQAATAGADYGRVHP